MIDLRERKTTVELEKTKAGEQIILAGWVQEIRNLGKIAFIMLRDRDGIAQIVVSKDFPEFSKLVKLNRESVIAVQGTVKG